jgi:hypothetical protein
MSFGGVCDFDQFQCFGFPDIAVVHIVNMIAVKKGGVGVTPEMDLAVGKDCEPKNDAGEEKADEWKSKAMSYPYPVVAPWTEWYRPHLEHNGEQMGTEVQNRGSGVGDPQNQLMNGS